MYSIPYTLPDRYATASFGEAVEERILGLVATATQGNAVFREYKAGAAPAYENKSTIESAELLLSYNVEPFLARLTGTCSAGRRWPPVDLASGGEGRRPVASG